MSRGLGDVYKRQAYIGLDAVLTADPEVILNADGVLLPGVGAYASAVAVLKERGLVDVLHEVVKREIPLLGICLGMQLLFEESEEYGPTPGLGLIPGKVKEIPRNLGLSVPHMGWNKNVVHQPHSAFNNVDDQYTYFVHSYYLKAEEDEAVSSRAQYGVTIDASVQKDRLFATQFHPEKSGEVGLNMLRRFAQWKGDKSC